MAMNVRRSKNPLSALLDYATARGDEASSIGSVMSQLASPILKGQGVQVDNAVQRGPVPQPTLVEFNTTSKERLAGADPRLSGFMTEVEKRANAQGINMQIAEAKRTADRQAELVASGTSPTMNSHHLTGNAADIYLVGPDGKPNYNVADYQPVADIAKTVAAEQGLPDFQWGGDWKSKDAVHFQLGGSPNLNTTVSTMGGPETGGALPQTVEGILSTLYPTAAEDEKTAHRKDIWRGLSQGLSALSQGRPVDLSNIATNADTRRRQYVLDTREKEKAKAAASLVYSQTGDANMAAGVASGAISYTDVLNERQMKRVEKDAQDARLKDAATTDALVTAMKAGKMPQATIDLVQKGGVEALSAYQKIQADQSLLEQEAKQQDIRDQNVADARYILSTAAPGSTQARAAERVIALNGEEDVYTLMKDRAPAAGAAVPDQIEYADALVAGGKYPDRATALQALLAKPAGGATPDQIQYADILVAGGKYPDQATALQALLAKGGDGGGGTANMQDAQALVDSGAINAATNKPYTLAEATAATILIPPAPPNMQYVLGPNNQLMLAPITPAAGGAPTAGGAPAATGGAPAATGGAPAGTVGGAFSTTFGSVNDAAKAALLPGDIAQQTATLADTIAGTAATEQATATAAAAAPTELDIKKTTLATNRQQLEQTIAQEQDVNKKVAAEAQLADLKVQEAQLAIDELKASAPTDAEKAKVDLANAQANLESARLDNEKKHRELADAEVGKAASLAASLVRANTSAYASTSTVSKLLNLTADWESGRASATMRSIDAAIPGSPAYDVANVLIPQLEATNIISNIMAMKAASSTGATGFGATNAPELAALTDLLGKLDVKGSPDLLRENTRVLNNYILDSAYGTQEQLKANDKLTDAEKEFYGQRYDPRSGEIKYLGLLPIDEGVITIFDKPAEPLDLDSLTPAERALYDSTLPKRNN